MPAATLVRRFVRRKIYRCKLHNHLETSMTVVCHEINCVSCMCCYRFLREAENSRFWLSNMFTPECSLPLIISIPKVILRLICSLLRFLIIRQGFWVGIIFRSKKLNTLPSKVRVFQRCQSQVPEWNGMRNNVFDDSV